MAEKAEKEEVRKRRPQRVTEGPLRGPQFKFIMRWVKCHWNVSPFWTKIGRGWSHWRWRRK